ncbi:protein-disulfide reductase DsbD [Glaesserella parasuis]|uniref:Thiol:disulfide interchange protein DsbD n=1 Tax=Glaesserella parasuis HPS10 TaxID=1450514 RepID=A0A836Z1H3_GLAPU|nr:protein-disulfide reductase DsbD [Glaesserella parasuis]ATW42443.1 protein-disulfide reductase DsbD [Glaesserella parasuis D74]EQA07922.1 activator of DsbC [Glaesserella parasuis D74]KDB45444.1 thiol:disulfide interchange protein [Glaesserella parasuis HPS10]MCT8540394.1 protein-disulfide reductase DsbD [Glaesserella parasuis]MCT8605841.1 protein-disulfide reductase DsbD [Glaesserella parasuis]
MFKIIFTLFSLSTFYLPATASLFSSQPKFLPGDQAFAFSSQQQADQLQLAWQIADGYYLYKKEIAISSNNAKLGEPQFPTAERYQDEFFGEVEIYRNQLTIPVALEANATGQVVVRYQGCTKGFCYPPEEVTLDLQAATSADNVAKNTADVTAISIAQPKAEQNQLAETLAENRLAIFWFFVLGLGLAFTPCVLPMLPLLSAIVIGSKQRPNSLRAFLLSLSYVQGMAVTYTLLGLLVAAIGLPFQVALQSPPVLIGLSLLFILLAMSMFGLFTLQLPHRWQQKLNQLSQQQQGGSFFSVFVMGMIAGLVASPCTSAPLSGALLYVAQSGDLLTGGLALYLLALGMGIPLMLVTLFGNRILPKSGDWLLKVKTLFGFVMLALPVFLLSRVLPTFIEPLLWSALAIAFLLWLNEQCNGLQGWKKVFRLLVLATLVVASKPWLDLAWQPMPANQTQSNHFKRIHSLAELEQQLTANKGKKVMLDLYADWCVACKEFEKYTFVDPKVQAKLAEMAVLQIDMTKNSGENDELMKHFQVLGLPTILFFDEQGRELSQSRVTGFMQAGDFVQWLNGLTQ